MEFIARVQLQRTINSVLVCGADIRASVILSHEDFSPINGLIHVCTLSACFVKDHITNSVIEDIDEKIESEAIQTIVLHGDVAVLLLRCPTVEDSYRLRISVKSYPDNYFIMPLLTDKIVVCQQQSSIQSNKLMLTTIRKLPSINNQDIFIKEEYGTTIGSHIWDSSIVLFNYLQQSLSTIQDDTKNGLLLELGAGCGLVGISLAYQFKKVYLTDKLSQLPFLTDNIHLNDVTANTVAYELDWTSATHITQLHNELNNNPLHTIIAADVLYDPILAEAFFSVCRILAKPSYTQIYVAQKTFRGLPPTVYSNLHTSCNSTPQQKICDIATVTGFHSRKLLERAGVAIWAMTLC